MASESLVEVNKIKQTYLTDFMTLLSFSIEKGEAEEEEFDFQEQLRKARKGK